MFIRLAPIVNGVVKTDQQFVLGETHLKAMDEGRAARTAQVGKILDRIGEKFKDVPYIQAGDFNDFPWTAPLLKMRESFVDMYSLKSIQTENDISLMNRHDFEFPDYTLICDTRKAKIGPSPDHRCLDYVFVKENDFFKNNQIVIEKYLELPKR